MGASNAFSIPLALALALAPAGGCTCTGLAGQGAQLEQAARRMEQLKALPLLSSRASLALDRVRVAHVVPEPARRPPRAVFTVEAEGWVELPLAPAARVAVSSIGVERVPMRPATVGGFTPVGSPLPCLAGVVDALVRRATAADPPRFWAIRAEPDQVRVTETRASGRRRSSTLRALDGGCLFASGLVPE